MAAEAALAVLQPILRGLTQEDQPKATPCADFTCHELSDHLMSSIAQLGAMAGATVTNPEQGSLENRVSLMAGQAIDAWRKVDLDGTVPGPRGSPMPAAFAASKADVRRLLLGDSRIAARISETLGRRLSEIEQRLSDAIFKSVPERIAGTLVTLAGAHGSRPLGRGIQVKLTHEQLAALAGTSRETTTKILNEYADLGLVSRGRINILDPDRMRRAGGL